MVKLCHILIETVRVFFRHSVDVNISHFTQYNDNSLRLTFITYNNRLKMLRPNIAYRPNYCRM